MYLPKLASARDIQRDYRRLADLVKKTQETVIIMKNNQPDVALVDIKRLEYLERQSVECEELKTIEEIRKGKKEFLSGKAKLLKGNLSDLIGR